MNFQTKESKMTDGSPVFDVNLFPNGRDWKTRERKVIFSCTSEADMISFVNGLRKLIEDFTVEILEEGHPDAPDHVPFQRILEKHVGTVTGGPGFKTAVVNCDCGQFSASTSCRGDWKSILQEAHKQHQNEILRGGE